jgi:hypothetical protein
VAKGLFGPATTEIGATVSAKWTSAVISNLRRSRNELVEAHAIKYRLPDKGDQLQSPYCPTDTTVAKGLFGPATTEIGATVSAKWTSAVKSTR